MVKQKYKNFNEYLIAALRDGKTVYRTRIESGDKWIARITEFATEFEGRLISEWKRLDIEMTSWT